MLFLSNLCHVPIAQLVEHATVNRRVRGSSPLGDVFLSPTIGIFTKKGTRIFLSINLIDFFLGNFSKYPIKEGIWIIL